MLHDLNHRSQGGYWKLDQIRSPRDEDLCLLILDIAVPQYIVREKGQN